jgi:hypothetical protein
MKAVKYETIGGVRVERELKRDEILPLPALGSPEYENAIAQYNSLMAKAYPTVRRVKGPTILLGSGGYFDYDYPEETPLSIEDYVCGLAFECRFRGQNVEKSTGRRVYYSVAQHAVLCSYEAERYAANMPGMHDAIEELAFEALMHESGEPVCGDMVSPLKSKLPEYKTVEKYCEHAIGKSFGVGFHFADIVKNIDNRMWATERRDLMNWNGEEWTACAFEPYSITIDPLGPYEAERQFYARWLELGGEERMRNARV